MTNKQPKTNLPWTVGDASGYFFIDSEDIGDAEIATISKNPVNASINPEANANFTVKAVNNHNKLIDMVREQNHAIRYLKESELHIELIEKAQALLSKLGETTNKKEG